MRRIGSPAFCGRQGTIRLVEPVTIFCNSNPSARQEGVLLRADEPRVSMKAPNRVPRSTPRGSKAIRISVACVDYIPAMISFDVCSLYIQRDAPWVNIALSLSNETSSMIRWIHSRRRGLRIVTDRFIQVSQLEFFMRPIR